MWYIGGDNKNGESKKAGKAFFNTDHNFNIAEYFHFCNRLLKKEPKERGKAPCMIVFCSYEQQAMVIEYAKKHGFKNYIPISFIKNYSAQALKANMRVVGATEYALILYRGKLPKFNNNHKMIFNWFEWRRDNKNIIPKIHPTQKQKNDLETMLTMTYNKWLEINHLESNVYELYDEVLFRLNPITGEYEEDKSYANEMP